VDQCGAAAGERRGQRLAQLGGPSARREVDDVGERARSFARERVERRGVARDRMNPHRGGDRARDRSPDPARRTREDDIHRRWHSVVGRNIQLSRDTVRSVDNVRSDGARRREAILDAALACFAKRGVAATGIEDIRLKAKASPSSVYHHFGGLDGVVLALLERTFARLFSTLAERVTCTRTARAAVLALVEAHLDWVLENPVEARVMYQAMSLELGGKVTGPLAKKKAELLAPVVAHLLAFVEKGALPRWSPLHFDVVILGVAHEACRRHLAGAPIEAIWMRETLPALAWEAVRKQR
jgi:AcrR family transcriptional regulator